MIALVPYLFVVLLVEISAKYLVLRYNYNTGGMYNLMNLFCHLFYGFLFYRFAVAKEFRQTILILIGSYAIVSIFYYSITSFYSFNHYIITIGGIIQVFFACLYFYQFLLDDSHSYHRHYSSGLIIASGVLIFYSGIAICFSLYNYIRMNELLLFGVPLYNFIPRYLSIILYLLISLAIIVWKKPAKTLY
ncbi:hypothetical protein [Pedobacter sp. MW01-1-1]|uniref:hypothetical protein n=1 Tax=Pedobacter sp. MW01-1-1 TaxID=3383027 RepID=UPI003FEF8A2C